MDKRMVVESFKIHFLEAFRKRIRQAHRPGNSLGDVARLLQPFDLAMTLAEGADKVCSVYRGMMSRQTADAIEDYMETTISEAKALLPEWNNIVQALQSWSSKGPLDRLSSREAELGDDIASVISEFTGYDFAVSMIGRLLGAVASTLIELGRLEGQVRHLDASYARYCSSAHSRFHRTILPSFEKDAMLFRG